MTKLLPGKPQPKLKESEKDVQRAILDYLDTRRIFHWRNNTGAVKTPEGRFFRFGATGSPDIVAIIKGRFVGIECKGTKGVLSYDQMKFGEEVRKAGGIYIVAHNLEELVEALKENQIN